MAKGFLRMRVSKMNFLNEAICVVSSQMCLKVATHSDAPGGIFVVLLCLVLFKEHGKSRKED